MRQTAVWVLTAVLAAGLCLAGCGGDREGNNAAGNNAARDSSNAAAPAGLRIGEIKPVMLPMGGMTTVRVTVERNGVQGPLTVRFEDLPRGVTAVDPNREIVGDEGDYVLRAAGDAAMVREHNAKVVVRGRQNQEQNTRLTISIQPMATTGEAATMPEGTAASPPGPATQPGY